MSRRKSLFSADLLSRRCSVDGTYADNDEKDVASNPLLVDDLVSLPTLDEQSFLDALGTRFGADKIYTTAADVLIAINPFQTVIDEVRRVARDPRKLTIIVDERRDDDLNTLLRRGAGLGERARQHSLRLRANSLWG